MISNYASGLILANMCGKTQYANIAQRAFLALSATEPQATGDGVTEPIGNGYVRKQIGYYQDKEGNYMGEPSGNTIINAQEIHFNEATGDWGTMQYVCIFDAAEGGHLIAWGTLGETVDGIWQPKPITPEANTVVVIRAGDLKISLV